MMQLADLEGTWRRSLIAWPDGRQDVTTSVTWMQGPRLYVDFRRPSDLPAFKDVRCLRDLDATQASRLAAQEGFAGVLIRHDDCFEWTRLIDYQPKPLYSDRGTLTNRGDLMVEEGLDVAYVEHWRRADGAHAPTGAFCLIDRSTGCRAVLVMAGLNFMFARSRGTQLDARLHLVDCVARAASLTEAQDFVDCELSRGSIEAGWRIEHSSLPWRVGAVLDPTRVGGRLQTSDVDPDGEHLTRFWTISAEEGAGIASLAAGDEPAILHGAFHG